MIRDKDDLLEDAKDKDTGAAAKYDDIAKKLQPAPAKRPKDKAAG